MTKTEIKALICKGLGIYTLVGAISTLPGAFLFASRINRWAPYESPEGMMRLSAYVNLLPPLISFVLGILLLGWANSLTARAEKSEAASPRQIGWGHEAQIGPFRCWDFGR